MKTIAFLSLLFGFIPVFSQDREMIFITGMVTDVVTHEPVEGQQVFVISSDSLYQMTMTTNQAGLFGDTVELDIYPAGYLYFYTQDCLGQVHDTLVSLNTFMIFVSFSICTNAQVNTYDLGGFLFAGDYPINNPYPTGDTAQAVLYRIVQDNMFPVDTLIFHEIGYYWFSKMPEGKYLIKSHLRVTSDNYTGYIPTYYGDQMRWPSAFPITLDRDLYHADIHLIELHNVVTGPGSIKGNVLFEAGFHNGQSIPSENIEVLLLDPYDLPVRFQCTDSEGSFSFQDLAYGTYKILADETGMYSQPVEVSITDYNPSESVTLSLYENDIFGMGDSHPESNAASIVRIYPNPVSDDPQIQILVRENSGFSIQMINGQGGTVSDYFYQLLPGEHTIQYPCTGLPSGLYLIIVRDNNGKLIDSEKVVK